MLYSTSCWRGTYSKYMLVYTKFNSLHLDYFHRFTLLFLHRFFFIDFPFNLTAFLPSICLFLWNSLVPAWIYPRPPSYINGLKWVATVLVRGLSCLANCLGHHCRGGGGDTTTKTTNCRQPSPSLNFKTTLLSARQTLDFPFMMPFKLSLPS